MRTQPIQHPTPRHVVLALILLSIAGVFLVDVYLTPWRVPTTILYAIPIVAAARFLSVRATMWIVAFAIAAEVLEAWILGTDIITAALAIAVLAMIGVLGVLWARVER